MPAVHKELLKSITSAALAIFEAEACSLALLSEDEGELIFYATSGGRAGQVDGMRVPVGHGIAGWVVASGQAIAIEDVSDDPRFASDVAATLGHTPQSIVAMPLQTERGVLGVIEMLDPESATRNRMDLVGLFAQQAALAVESARVFATFGRALFEAVAKAAPDPDLAEGLRQIADEAPQPHPNVGEVALLLNELAGRSPEEAHLAVRVLQEFLTYGRGRGRLT